jgi:hypothetical protein
MSGLEISRSDMSAKEIMMIKYCTSRKIEARRVGRRECVSTRWQRASLVEPYQVSKRSG